MLGSSCMCYSQQEVLAYRVADNGEKFLEHKTILNDQDDPVRTSYYNENGEMVYFEIVKYADSIFTYAFEIEDLDTNAIWTEIHVYDSAGLLTYESLDKVGSMKVAVNHYRADGQLYKRKLDLRGSHFIEYCHYDVSGRITTRKFWERIENSDSMLSRETKYHYNKHGKLVSEVLTDTLAGSGQINYQYDLRGRKRKVSSIYDLGYQGHTVIRYRGKNIRTTVQETFRDDQLIFYRKVFYDRKNRLRKEIIHESEKESKVELTYVYQ